MPGMTGGELIDQVRARWPDVRVIMATGYTEREGAKRDFPILRKPFLQKALGQAIDREIAAWRASHTEDVTRT